MREQSSVCTQNCPGRPDKTPPPPAQETDCDSRTPPLAILELQAMTKDLDLKGLGSMTFRLRKDGGPDLCSDWPNLPQTSA